MSARSKNGFVFTGWHMVGVVMLFFGTIITVNVFMAYNAVTTWSGLVVPNTYVASQQFNGKVAEARALAAAGVNGRLSVTSGNIRYDLLGPDGRPADADHVALHFKRPVGEHQDFAVDLRPVGRGVFAVSHKVQPGHWIVEASAELDGARILHHAERISVPGAQE